MSAKVEGNGVIPGVMWAGVLTMPRHYDDSEELIARLAAAAKPVHRLWPPGWRVLAWLATAGAIVAFSVAWYGFRNDLAEKVRDPIYVLEWTASLATAIGAFIAVFHLSLPDRSPRWLAVALIPAGFWAAVIALGILRDFSEQGMHAFDWGVSISCFRYITAMGIPLMLVMLRLVRHAGPIRPVQSVICAGLGTAALSATGLSLFHYLNASWLVLIWHGSALVAVLGVSALGGLLLRAVARHWVSFG